MMVGRRNSSADARTGDSQGSHSGRFALLLGRLSMLAVPRAAQRVSFFPRIGPRLRRLRGRGGVAQLPQYPTTEGSST